MNIFANSSDGLAFVLPTLFLSITFAVIAFYFGVKAAISLYEAWLVQKTQTRDTNSLPSMIGRIVAVSGKVDHTTKLGDQQGNSVYQRLTVERELVDPYAPMCFTGLVVERDDDGKCPFFLVDSTGRILVDTTSIDRSLIGRPLIWDEGQPNSVRRLSEWRIKPRDEVYVLGRLVEQNSKLALVSPHERWLPLILSQYSSNVLFQHLVARATKELMSCFATGLVFGALAVVITLFLR